MYNNHELVDALARMALALTNPYDAASSLAGLNAIAIELFGLFGSGVTATVGGQRHSIVRSTEPSTYLAWFEEHLLRGPCSSTYNDGDVVCVTDVRECADRWPEVAEGARSSGIRAVAGIPMRIGEQRIGALTLYSDRPRVWREQDITAASALATMTTGYLLDSSVLTQREQLTARLDREVQNSVVIEQAKGVTAHDRQVSIEQAYRMIEQHATRNDTTVLAVAQAIINVGLRVRS